MTKRAEEARRSKADFVKHFKEKYGMPLPVWVLTELLDFGGLSMLYAGMKQKDRDSIAAELGLVDNSGAGNSGALKDWMRNLNYVRNVCAHHARFWNVNIVDQVSPRHLKSVPELAHITGAGRATSRPYASLSVIALLTKRIDANDDWAARMRDLIDTELPAGRTPSELGFPQDWIQQSIWAKACA